MRLRNTKLGEAYDQFRSRLKGTYVPPAAAAQAEHFAAILPYEDFVEHEGCTCALLADGSLGIAWSVGLVGHEALTASQLSSQMQALVQAFESIVNVKATIQIIWEQVPSSRFSTPPYAERPRTNAQRVMVERMEAIRAFNTAPTPQLRCIRRQGWITLRWQRPGRLGLDERRLGFLTGTATSALEDEAKLLRLEMQELREAVTLLEEGLESAGFGFARCDRTAIVQLIRTGHHSIAARERGWSEYNAAESIGSQLALETVTATQSALQLGDTNPDTLQVLSWGQKPTVAFEGMLTCLLRMHEPMRVVVTVRPCTDTEDLNRNEFFLRFALDAVGKRQYREITEAQTRLAHNEKAYWVGLHIVVRNQNCTLEQVGTRNAGQLVANRLKLATGIPFIVETRAAPLLYRQTLPFGYTPQSHVYTRRERRVFTQELSKYMTLYSGFPGVQTRSQLMLSRAGEPIYLSSRDNESSFHIAVLASSGSGKSFFMSNYLVGDRALYEDSLDFIIDRKTSYEILAKVLGEEGGVVIAKPPTTFPNIFLGTIDNDRLAVIVSILQTAIALASPKAELNAEHTVILSEALKKTFASNYIDAETVFEGGRLSKRGAGAGAVRVPRLSQVCDKFVEVCGEKGMPQEYASWLRSKLAPFCGGGPYASMFDREVIAPPDPPTPAVTLYDLDGVSSDQLQCTLTAMICCAEVIRQMKRPENAGRRGRLVVEELGTMGGQSPQLEEFIRVAWKTCRKMEYTCIGLTNEVDDYRLQDAARTVWNVSPTKVILPMTRDDLQKACSEDKVRGIPRLISSDHEAQLISTLRKRDGHYSEGLLLSAPQYLGTFLYAPTGFDYWLAASKPVEVQAVDKLAEAVGGPRPYWDALAWLARNAPRGFRSAEDRKVRAMTADELKKALTEIEAARAESELEAA